MAVSSDHDSVLIVPSELDTNGSCLKRSSRQDSEGPAFFSCSTSAGSLSPPPSPVQVAATPSHISSPAQRLLFSSTLPELEYPVPFSIRNTFIDTGIGRPVSLEEFYEERRVHSCPVQPPPGLEDEQAHGSQVQPAMINGNAISSAIAAAAAASAAAVAATRCWLQAASRTSVAACEADQAQNSFAMPKPPILLLADALAEPELGSPEKPTVGSAGHHSGTCKPCAFYYTKGCGNGVGCGFCHLCPAGEKKRRQKEKFASQREMHRVQLRP